LGEFKYGKPILDRVLTPQTPHREAAKCVLISFDSTLRSNISVGLPLDILWYPKDALRIGVQHKIREGDAYWTMLRTSWGGGLRKVFMEMDNPDWLE
jgi:putative proteasome-type protease